MKRIVIDKPFSVKIEEVEKPTVAPDEILIKTKFSGVSVGTEKAFYRGLWGTPINPGYEAAGIVVECGAEIRNIVTGDRVISLGNHAEFVKTKEPAVCKIPANLSFEEATFAILGTTALHAIERSNLKKNGSVAVVGLGTMGQLLMQYAHIEKQARTVGLDIVPEKLKTARELGANLVINSRNKNCLERLKKFIEEGVDVAIEVSGGAPEASEIAMQAVKKNGRVLLMGGATATGGIIHFPYRDNFFGKELEVAASNSWGPNGTENFKKTINLLAKGKLSTKGIRITKIKYTGIKKLYQDLIKNEGQYCHLILEW